MRLENTNPGHYKFWEIRVDGTVVTSRWGRIGGSAQNKSWTFPSEDAAAQYGEDQINRKVSSGYIIVSQ